MIPTRQVNHWLGILIFLCLTLLPGAGARADIYVYVDHQGVMHFTNTPTSSNYKVYMKETHREERSAEPRPWFSIESYDDVIAEAARLHGLSPYLLKAMIHVESYFNPKAVSKKGAMGLMQIMPDNLGPLNINDPFDPWENIMGGARYFRAMLERFNFQLPLALAAYNAGPSAVERYNDIPPYKETEDYVKKVMRFFRIYKNG